MAKWRCKCGYLLSTNIEVYTEIEEYEFVNTKEVTEYMENNNNDDALSYYEYENNVNHGLIHQCPDCSRLWFDIGDSDITSNSIIKSLVPTSNTISFKPEPVFLSDSVDIMEELERTADEADCEYELKYTRGKYTLKIDDKEINDESLSGVLQLLKYGKKY